MSAAQVSAGLDLRWDAVSHDYGAANVLSDVTLAIGAGESVALLGHNGAGKTTLTRMLMGLVRPKAGTVSVGDWLVAKRRPDQMAQRVGYAFQHADQQLFARTVLADVSFGPQRLGRPVHRAIEVLAELGLDGFTGRHPYDLPAPVRKLVTLAGVFAMEPAVLVLDEPTAGFDRGLRALVIAALHRRISGGVTVIAVSHDLKLVDAVSKRSVTLEQGRVVADSIR
ncbi:MAG TPA: ABC transporter ATP-binding protein [Gemmatimonadales bacterium]|jgi:energy-coupling factor transport system ATP-binding protein